MFSTIIGTNCFVSFESAMRYYGDRKWIQYKIDSAEIRIGKPELKFAQKLTVVDGGLRYAIIEPSQYDILRECARVFGRQWKSKLRRCWESSTYPAEVKHIENWLHYLRNSQRFGPKGLNNAKL